MNKRPDYEIADVLKQHYKLNEWKGILDFNQQKAFADILKCRTVACGGHVSKCNDCGYQRNEYNSCRNRNCPKCQFVKQQRWVDKLCAKLLPCKYFHVVFTVPAQLRSIFKANPETCYQLLFDAAQLAIKQCAKQRYAIDVGFIAVLHTWTQRLDYHPHLHFIVTAGGITEDEMEWLTIKDKFFAPQNNVSGIFRAILSKKIRKSIQNKIIKLPPHIGNYKKEVEDVLFTKNWKVFIERPFKGVNSVVQYLGKYVFRVAISNNRIKKVTKNEVSFYVRDNKQKAISRVVSLPPKEFISRFSAHIMPKGFYKIRHYGLFAPSNINVGYNKALLLIGASLQIAISNGLTGVALCNKLLTKDPWACPKCSKGKMDSVSECVTDGTG